MYQVDLIKAKVYCEIWKSVAIWIHYILNGACRKIHQDPLGYKHSGTGLTITVSKRFHHKQANHYNKAEIDISTCSLFIS